MSAIPKIFISSTIYDFRDLRSALRFWLESLGYEVMLSEYNDFEKPFDKDTYTACLEAVQRADYYVLLIGSRVGALYDTNQKVSVTRMEYRTAYELTKAGKMKLMIFVREDLWKIKEDRRALQDFLLNDWKLGQEVPETDIQTIVNHRSVVVNDAEAIFSFLDEVGRTEEMNEAAAGKGEFPVANWVHSFSEFRDILEVLKKGFNISERLEQVALITHLKAELCSNLSALTDKYEENIIPTYRFVAEARQFYDGKATSSSNIPGKYLKDLVLSVLPSTRASNLSTQFIDQALLSGQFLEFDWNLNTFRTGILDTATARLKENVSNLKNLVEEEPSRTYLQNFILKYGNYPYTDQRFAVENLELVMLFGVATLQENIVQLSVALFKALEGDIERLTNLKIKPPSPIRVDAKKIYPETPSEYDIIAWIRKQ